MNSSAASVSSPIPWSRATSTPAWRAADSAARRASTASGSATVALTPWSGPTRPTAACSGGPPGSFAAPAGSPATRCWPPGPSRRSRGVLRVQQELVDLRIVLHEREVGVDRLDHVGVQVPAGRHGALEAAGQVGAVLLDLTSRFQSAVAT